jgi:hypothetical protein
MMSRKKRDLLEDVNSFEELIKLLFENKDIITLNTKELNTRRTDRDISYSVNLIWQFIRTSPEYVSAYKNHQEKVEKLLDNSDPTDREIKEKESEDINFGRAWYLRDAIDYKQVTINASQMLLEEPVVNDRMISSGKLDNRAEFIKYSTNIEENRARPLIIHINPLFSEKAIIENVKDVLKNRRNKNQLEQIVTIGSNKPNTLIKHLAIRHILDTEKLLEKNDVFKRYCNLVGDREIQRLESGQIEDTTKYFKKYSHKMPWGLLQYK